MNDGVKLTWVDNPIIGCWQLSAGHTSRDLAGLAVLEAYYNAGFRVFDGADIYTGVEKLLGTFIAAHGLGPDDISIHTKYVPDLASLGTLERGDTEHVIARSRARLGLERLDLVQFHWWDYDVPGYLNALETLVDLKERGEIREIGLTNFDADHVSEIVGHGIPVASVQTQYSVLDRRPKRALAPLANEHDVALLCYGSVAGGLLSDRYLGAPEPDPPYENRSLVKYMLIVDEMGGWTALQAVLEVLREIADEKGTDIATIASAYARSQEAALACIVGVRHTGHLEQHVALREMGPLDAASVKRIEQVRSRYPEVPGQVYELERDVEGKHNKIMKFNLNTAAG